MSLADLKAAWKVAEAQQQLLQANAVDLAIDARDLDEGSADLLQAKVLIGGTLIAASEASSEAAMARAAYTRAVAAQTDPLIRITRDRNTARTALARAKRAGRPAAIRKAEVTFRAAEKRFQRATHEK